MSLDGVDSSVQNRVQDPDRITMQTPTSFSPSLSSAESNSWRIGQGTTTSNGTSSSSRQPQTTLQGSAIWTSNPFLISAYSAPTNTTAPASSIDGQTRNSKPVLKSSFADRIKKYVSTSSNDVQVGNVLGASKPGDSLETPNVADSLKFSVFDSRRLRRVLRRNRNARSSGLSRLDSLAEPEPSETASLAWSNISSARGLRQQSHDSNYLLRYGFNAQSQERAHHRRRAHKQGISRDRG